MKTIKHRTYRESFLRLAGIVTGLLGIGLILDPAPIVAFFNEGAPNTVHFVRFLGTALLGFGVLNWMVSTVEEPALILPVLYANLTSLGVASLIDVIANITGMLNPRGWLILLLHLIFGIGFATTIASERRRIRR